MIALLSLLVPVLLWDKPPNTADALKEAGISRILVKRGEAPEWNATKDISVEEADLNSYLKLQAPSVAYRRYQASATQAPWVNLNGWRFLRQPNGRFLYDVPGATAGLAAAEAFAYQANAAIHTDAEGVKSFARTAAFLHKFEHLDLPPMFNFVFEDDGSREASEFMNLLVRMNLLFRVATRDDETTKVRVGLGMPDYPRSEAANPRLMAEKVRARIGDQNRLLRIYGSDVVIGRLVGNDRSCRLLLINYGAARMPVSGLRIRVLGAWNKQRITQLDDPSVRLLDLDMTEQATEFTIPEMKSFAIVELSK